MTRPLIHPQVEALMKIIMGLPGNKIVTVALASQSQAFDVSSDGSIGHSSTDAHKLQTLLQSALKQSGSVIIRQFLHLQIEHTTPSGKKIWIPQKKLYGAFLNEGQFFGLKAEQLREAFAFDNDTGQPLPPEPAELYSDFPTLSPGRPA